MRQAIFLLLFLLPAIAFTQSTKDLDEKFGYKDIKLETDADSVIKATKARSGIVKLQTDNYVFYWVNDRTYQKFGAFNVAVAIGKHKRTGKVGCIALMPTMNEDQTLYKSMIKYFAALFGMPTEVDDIKEVSVWKGERAKLRVSYDYLSKNIMCIISSNEIEDMAEAESEEKLKKDIKDF